MEYKIVKEFTNNYQNIDREMVYLGVYFMYKDNDFQLHLENLGINREIYICLLDLPIIEIYNCTIEYFFQNMYTQNVNDFVECVNRSMNGFFIIKNTTNYYICKLNGRFTPFNKRIEDFLPFYRTKKLSMIFE